MKTALIAILLLAALPGAEAAPRQKIPKTNLEPADGVRANGGRANPNRPNAARANGQARPARKNVEDAIYRFYIKQFQDDPEMTPEILGKLIPFIDKFVDERFDVSARRTRALNQLRKTLNENGSEEELRRLTKEFDEADAEFQSNQEKFFKNIDPLLSVRLQARVRVIQNRVDNQIRQMLEEVQNPAAGQRRANAGAPPQ
jgi:hypothetical protein